MFIDASGAGGDIPVGQVEPVDPVEPVEPVDPVDPVFPVVPPNNTTETLLIAVCVPPFIPLKSNV